MADQDVNDIKTKLRLAFESYQNKFKLDPGKILEVHGNAYGFTKKFDLPGPDMAEVTDFQIPVVGDGSITLRLYKPDGLTHEAGPVFIYYHGGGFVACNLESHDALCRRIAHYANMRVLSVDYRLAPKHPFPAAVDDSRAALDWVLSGQGLAKELDPKRVAIGGDSAGGNLTAYLSQQYRRDLKAQLLLYPLMQFLEKHPAKPGPQDIFRLGEVALKFIDETYVCGADPRDPRLSPLFTEDLTKLPPAWILTCGLDPLRFEGKAYYHKLLAAGNKAELHHEKAMPHGFLNFAKAFPKATTLPADMAIFLRKYLKES